MTTTQKTTQDLIDRALRGEETDPQVVIYWDDQDPQNPGPAYRIGDPASGQQESGALDCVGFSEPSADGIVPLDGYFGRDGRYLGPDQDGLYPLLLA